MPKEVEKEREITAKTWWTAFGALILTRLLCLTVPLKVERDAEVQQLIKEQGGVIMATWHGLAFMPIVWLRNRRYCGLISLSRDGDLMTQHFRNLGWRVIRGSTGRRGVLATRQVLNYLEEPGSVMCCTPDGPRGPARVCQPGVVYFAQKSGKPIIPTAAASSSFWAMKSWDSFQIPKPFARGVWLLGDPIFVGPNEDIDAACRKVEAALSALEVEARERVSPSQASQRKETITSAGAASQRAEPPRESARR